MSIKQIEADIAEGRYVNPLTRFEEKLEELQQEAYITDDWDRGWVAALNCVREKLTECLKGTE